MGASDSRQTLAAADTLRLAEFARACKAATRIVALYPPTHPAITIALDRIADAATRLRLAHVAAIAVTPDGVSLNGCTPTRADGALAELATMLHAHLIGELRIAEDLQPGAWHQFLTLLARHPDEVRLEGGFAQLWEATGEGGLHVREIDYAEVLRARAGTLDAEWDDILANYLRGDASALDDETLEALLEIAADTQRFNALTERLLSDAADRGSGDALDAVLRVLQALADYCAREHPADLDGLLHRIAGSIPRLTPDLVIRLLAGSYRSGDSAAAGVDLAAEVTARITDQTIGAFVAQAVARDRSATPQLAHAFGLLVPDPSDRPRVVTMAADAVHALPAVQDDDFQRAWADALHLLTEGRDDPSAPQCNGAELALARAAGVDLERLTDDPPERIRAWKESVNDASVRRLEHRVLLDLLALETRGAEWALVAESVIAAIDQLVLTEQLPLAHQLLDALLNAAADDQPHAEAARAALERLRNGPLMRHVVLFLRDAPAVDIDAACAFCQAVGPAIIGVLADALAAEQGPAVKRLRDVLLSFGPAGRAYADSLRSSPNPAVRRTAITLLRTFGGAEALPDLTALLDDAEPAVQREALRAIVQLGSDEAFSALHAALVSSSARTRDAVMKGIVASRDERAVPLFAYIVEHSNPYGPLEDIYLAAIAALGKLGADEASVRALSHALHGGQWWAPLRTRRVRSAAAAALQTCRSQEARVALEQAALTATPGVRRIARAALQTRPMTSPAERTA